MNQQTKEIKKNWFPVLVAVVVLAFVFSQDLIWDIFSYLSAVPTNIQLGIQVAFSIIYSFASVVIAMHLFKEPNAEKKTTRFVFAISIIALVSYFTIIRFYNIAPVTIKTIAHVMIFAGGIVNVVGAVKSSYIFLLPQEAKKRNNKNGKKRFKRKCANESRKRNRNAK